MSKLLRASSNATVFYYANSILNVFPIHFLDAVRICLERIFSMFGQKLSKEFSTVVRVLVSCRSLPMDYHPFSSPSTPWRFKSCLRLAEEWDLFEYVLICGRAAYAFALNPLQGPERGYAKEFSEIRICSKETAMTDALLAFVHPEASIFYSIAAFVVRLGLSWISLTVTVDGTSLSSITSLDAPLVLCPQHRSVLDFVIIGLMCSQLQPLLYLSSVLDGLNESLGTLQGSNQHQPTVFYQPCLSLRNAQATRSKVSFGSMQLADQQETFTNKSWQRRTWILKTNKHI